MTFVAFILLAITVQAQAYIGPGAGFAVLGSFFAVFVSLLSAITVLFTWPIRLLSRSIRGRRAHRRARVRRVVILGLDGMEPTLTDRFLAEGKLPNFARLRDMGCYTRLATTLPPISPVAWSSFLTGSNPGKHNIYDFLARDKRTYHPVLSSVRIREPRRRLRIGRYEIPIGRPEIRLLRKGRPFWNVLGDHGVFSGIIRVPITFPPEPMHGVLLSAMCVPDLRGSQGMFSVYTTRTPEEAEPIGGEWIHVRREGRQIRSHLVGPQNPFRADHRAMACRFVITLAGADDAMIRINGAKHVLKQGVYSDWIKVEFKAAFGIRVSGICQFLLLRTNPHFELYVTPINIDPERPAMPISHPRVYSTYLAKLLGPFATLGLAEDSWGLNAGVLDDETYLHQVIQADQEREGMFFDTLAKVRRGLCTCVFDGTDRIQHMFWRYIDPGHPADQRDDPKLMSDECRSKDSPLAAHHSSLIAHHSHRRDAIPEHYQRLDALVGKTLAQCDDSHTVLMVISDHGFKPFRRGVDLNRWLEENGYLKIFEGQRDRKHLAGVDWSATRAFAIGLAGIYLNIRGREGSGIVDTGEEADRLRGEIAAALQSLVDPANGASAIRQVYISKKCYTGPYSDEAPDLIVGYREGYRVSWEAAIGQSSESVFHDNRRPWSGDHCIDPTLVPGVLFCNRKISTENPRLMDIGPTVLDLFGVDVPKHMDGRPLAVATENS